MKLLLSKICGLTLVVVMSCSGATHAAAQSGAAPLPSKQQDSGSPFTKLRSISGAAGHETDGRFVMDDARSIFTAGKDTKVIVYFEWEGPVGPHHFEGLWKSPEGKIVLISDFRYEAKGRRYSGYWTMLLSEGTPSGEWSIEARIDGEAAGTHSFMITGSPVPPTPTAPQPLSEAELYKRVMDATAVIEKVAPDGTTLARSSGFWVADNEVFTSFGAIDGAGSIKVKTRDGKQVTTDQVLAWNRWQDWTLLRVPSTAPARLKRGPAGPLNVGDQCAFLLWGPAGAKLTDGTITGKNSFPKAGPRLIVASGATPESFGGALLNSFGEYVGVVGGAVAPGSEPAKILGLMNDTSGSAGYVQMESSALAVPLSLLPDGATNVQPVTLSELARRGEFLPLVKKSPQLGFATIAAYVEKQSARATFVRNYREIFSHRDGRASVYADWEPVSKQKTTCALLVYDLENSPVTQSKIQKLSLSPGQMVTTTWDITLAPLKSGIYRVDLVLGNDVVWRDYLKVAD